MAVNKNCEQYSAFVFPTKSDTLARINFHCEDGYKLYVLFQDPGEEELPDNEYLDSYKLGRAYALLSQYPNFLDLARNESPVRVAFIIEDSPPRFIIYAGHEGIGEGEM